jgi:low affinity Fe/Cu permease
VQERQRGEAMTTTVYIVLGVAVLLVLTYIFAIRDLVRQSRALDKKVDYSKLRPQDSGEEDDY